MQIYPQRLEKSVSGWDFTVQITTTGDLGVGTIAPIRKLHANIEDATNNDFTPVGRFVKRTSGTPQVGIGSAIELITENGSNLDKTIAQFISILTAITNGAEYSKIQYRMIENGAMTIRNEIKSDGSRISEKVIKKSITKTGLADNVATEIFKIKTTDEVSNDGGTFVVFIRGVIGHPGNNAASSQSSKAYSACFSRAVIATMGTGANSAVTEIVDATTAATASGTRDIGVVTPTVTNPVDEFNTVFNLQVDTTGSSATTYQVTFEVELIYTGFTTPPEII